MDVLNEILGEMRAKYGNGGRKGAIKRGSPTNQLPPKEYRLTALKQVQAHVTGKERIVQGEKKKSKRSKEHGGGNRREKKWVLDRTTAGMLRHEMSHVVNDTLDHYPHATSC